MEYLVSSFTTIWNITTWNQLVNFKIILLSIIIEAFPFLLLSVIISSLLNNFVSENSLRNIIPKDNLLSIIIACFLGLLFPVCDCGMVPIVRRLILKGIPLPAGIAFMLAAPIVNPVVGTATAFAFQNNSNVVLLRLGVALIVAFCTGIIINVFFKGSELKALSQIQSHAHGCCQHVTANHIDCSLTNKIFNTIRDASNEFFEMGKYLFMGAMLGALSQIVVPHEMLVTLGQHSFLSIGAMMLFAFFISVCSAADAFIAASFNANFTVGSLVAFMVFGPMIDLKNILMLLHTFHTRFVVCLILIIIILCSSAAYIINIV